eukprot:scaffold58326_cov56-Phaeocystis_antarctica.AAC.1
MHTIDELQRGRRCKVGLVAKTAGLLALVPVLPPAKPLTGRGRRILRVQLAPIRAKAWKVVVFARRRRRRGRRRLRQPVAHVAGLLAFQLLRIR